MRILVSHTNYPSQFRRLIPSWISEGHEVSFIARSREWHSYSYDHLRILSYQRSRDLPNPYIHPYLRRFESSILEGQAAFRRALDLQSEGWVPDVVISHVGFGNGIFLKDLFPDAHRIGLVEWFYNPYGSDADFLSSGAITTDHLLNLRTWNAESLLEISSLDRIVTPTHWQKSQFPSFLQDHIQVVHEGIDVDYLGSLKEKKRYLPSCLSSYSDSSIEIMTYVSRCFEPYRGFPQAIQVIAELQRLRPNLHTLLVGSDGSAYGPTRSDGVAWSDWARNNFNLDPDRTHWLGPLNESEYHNILSCSDVHFYLTVPFILSWSLLEAMGVGLPIVSCTTPPVLEVLTHQVDSLLADFFDIEAHVKNISRVLDDRTFADSISNSARLASYKYSLANGVAGWSKLMP